MVFLLHWFYVLPRKKKMSLVILNVFSHFNFAFHLYLLMVLLIFSAIQGLIQETCRGGTAFCIFPGSRNDLSLVELLESSGITDELENSNWPRAGICGHLPHDLHAQRSLKFILEYCTKLSWVEICSLLECYLILFFLCIFSHPASQVFC